MATREERGPESEKTRNPRFPKSSRISTCDFLPRKSIGSQEALREEERTARARTHAHTDTQTHTLCCRPLSPPSNHACTTCTFEGPINCYDWERKVGLSMPPLSPATCSQCQVMNGLAEGKVGFSPFCPDFYLFLPTISLLLVSASLSR